MSKELQPSVLDAWLAKKLPAHANTLDFPTRLYAEQWERFCETLSYAKSNSSFYAKMLESIETTSLSPDVLCNLPFTTAQDLQHWEQFLCTSLSDIERMVSLQTSGTTSPPKRLAFSEEDLQATKDFFAVGMSQLVAAQETLLALWPAAQLPQGVTALLRSALAVKNITVVSSDPAVSVENLKAALMEHNPHCVVGAPSQLTVLADLLENTEHMQDIKQKNAPLALYSVLSSGENVTPSLQNRLQKLGLMHLDHYGITESGYSIGVECPAKNGYHIRELDVFIEIINIDGHTAMPNGEEGEIVITTLNRKAMPLIRYRTGDVAKILTNPCPCGSPLRRLSPLLGRIIRNGKLYSIEQCNKGNLYERTAPATL